MALLNRSKRLIISQQVFKVSQKPSEYRRTAFGSKTKVPSQQVQKHVIIFHQGYAQLTGFHPCKNAFLYHTSLACLRTCLSEGITHFCFRNHLRCFKVKLTPCVKINESNNNVGRATVFDTKKRCDEQVPIDVTADFHLASEISPSTSGNFEHSRTFRHLFHTGPKPETLRDTQTSNLAIPGQREWRGQTLGICRRQRRSYSMRPR